MGSGTNSADHLFRLGGSEDELDVGWRLFNNFQKRVEALSGDHVGFIKNEDLVAVSSWGEDRTLAKFASIINSVVRCSINLDNIK